MAISMKALRIAGCVVALLPQGTRAWAAVETPAAMDGGTAMTLADALRLGEAHSPELAQAQARSAQADASAGMAASFYFPQIVAAAATGDGLAASPGWAPLGVAGVLGSPFRIEPKPAGDIAAYWDLLDVSQSLGHVSALRQVGAAKEQERLTRIRVNQGILLQYFGALRATGQAQVWHDIADRIAAVYRVVRQDAKRGRYTEVQRLLIQERAEQAALAVVTAQDAAATARQALAIQLGWDGREIELPAPEASESQLKCLSGNADNPLLAYARSQREVARAQSAAALAQALPRLYGNVSIGTVDKTMLVPDEDYSVSIGLAVPLFSGLRVFRDHQRAQARVRETDALVDDASRQIALGNLQYDEAVAIAREQLASLHSREKAAQRNVDLSQARYFHLTGPLSDLLDALKNLGDIELQANASQWDLVSDLGAQKLFNGAIPTDSSKRGVKP